MKFKLFIVGTAFATLLGAGTAGAAALPHDSLLKCQERVDEELARAGLQDLAHATKTLRSSSQAIDASAFVKNSVGQYPAYLLVNDAASKELVGELISEQASDRARGSAPADRMIALNDNESAKMVLFLNGKGIVGYSTNLLSQSAGKSVVLNSQCQPVKVNVTLPPVSSPYMTPVINLNSLECSHLFALEYFAKRVELSEHEDLFDGLCRIRGGSVEPENHSIDDDIDCKCPNGRLIDPELEHWSEADKTCLRSPVPSNSDQFASLISYQGSLVNGGFQALVSQLKKQNSVIAQQCRLYFGP